MAIFLSDLNNAAATNNAYKALHALFKQTEEWKHYVESAKLVAAKVVSLIEEGKLIPGEKVSPEELERLVAVSDVEAAPYTFNLSAEYLFNNVNFDSTVTEEALVAHVMDYWTGVTEEAYYLDEFAQDISAEFDSLGNITVHEATLA